MKDQKLQVHYLPITDLKPSTYNPRKWSKEKMKQLKESIKRFDCVDPLIVNNAPKRKNVLIGGHFRLAALTELKYSEVPVVYVHISDETKEKELNMRLNKNVGEFDFDLLAEFDEAMLTDVGFSSEELDSIFGIDENPEVFNLKKELEKLNISEVQVQKGDVYQLGNHRLMCGDSTIKSDFLKLMNGQKSDMCLTDPPYILDYLNGKKKHGKATEGFGYKRDRKYLETDTIPENFTELWMSNIAKTAKPDFHIICYENWKNLRIIWAEMEKYWKVRNMIVWRLPNRNQGFAGKYKFFSKHDIAMVGSGDTLQGFNLKDEDELLQNEYETALYAINGNPHWEAYGKGKKYCPTDFIDYKASDEKNSGQSVIFGTKPVEILMPYIKVLTKRDDLIVEPFGGSGSTLIAAEKMKRRCNIMEKVPAYTEVIKKRWETLTGTKAELIEQDKTYGKPEKTNKKPKKRAAKKRESTTAKRIRTQKTKMIEMLEKMPIVQIACKRVGIDKSTYYRWCQSDPEFESLAYLAKQEGNENVNELAKSKLIEEIGNSNMTATIFWLKSRDPEFIDHRRITNNVNIRKEPEVSKEAAEAIDNVFTLFERKALREKEKRRVRMEEDEYSRN